MTTVFEELQRLEGIELYKYYVGVLHRNERFHETNPEYYPVDFQYEDWAKADVTKEACFVRACGGSKTFDMTLWLVLRVILHKYEKWAWCAAASGQLLQARLFFLDNPFVKSITGGKGEQFINLVNGAKILFRGTTKSITGVRLDGIILDEEEMLEANQVEMVYPQLHGRMSNSSVGKFFHLGTMQYGTLFMQNIDNYPSFIHDWTQCPWLVKAGQIQHHIDTGIMPDFEINMLYRCIPSVPGGLFFQNLRVLDINNKDDSPLCQFDPEDVDYGVDFGGTDHAVGVIVKGDICTIVDEREFDLEANNSAIDDLRGHKIKAEGGMYNDDVRYSAKCQMLVGRLGALRVLPTNKWKKLRKFQARGFREIRIIKAYCQKTLVDMQGCMFGLNGLWLKDKKHPCHWIDGYMLAIHGNHSIVDVPKTEHHRRTRYVMR